MPHDFYDIAPDGMILSRSTQTTAEEKQASPCEAAGQSAEGQPYSREESRSTPASKPATTTRSLSQIDRTTAQDVAKPMGSSSESLSKSPQFVPVIESQIAVQSRSNKGKGRMGDLNAGTRSSLVASILESYPFLAEDLILNLLETYDNDISQVYTHLAEYTLGSLFGHDDVIPSRRSDFPTPGDGVASASHSTGADDIEQVEEAEQSDIEAKMELLYQIQRIMFKDGWCPHQINYLSQVHDVCILGNFMHIGRRPARPESHKSCLKEDRCIAYNTPLGQGYRTRHTEACAGAECTFIEVPEQDLIKVVESGGVPLISIHESKSGDLSLRVHRRSFYSTYVSISHVWADGLGNPTQNALPECQIREMQSLLQWKAQRQRHLQKDMYDRIDHWIFGTGRTSMFWMDTLCIPVRPEHGQLRTWCIDAMASIYESSTAVFVFDKELMATPKPISIWEDPVAWSGPENWSKGLYLIAASVWMCRSWTLQEAILPPMCIFKFSDGLFIPIRSWYFSSEDREISESLFDGFLETRLPPRGSDEHIPYSRIDSEVDRFVSTWNQLAGRGTTKAEDVYIVLACCLNIKPRQFQQLQTTEEKMQHILCSHAKLPLDLFFNSGPRVRADEDHYNRWIPTQVSNHILTSPAASTFTFAKAGSPTVSGQGSYLHLQLRHEVRVLIVPTEGLRAGVFLVATDTEMYLIRSYLPASVGGWSLPGDRGMCLILARTPHRHSEVLKGACFWITDAHQSDQGDQAIELVYCYPILAKALPWAPPDGQTCVMAHEIEAESYEFKVRYSPIPNFKPLERQYPLHPAGPIMTILYVPWGIISFIVVFMLPCYLELAGAQPSWVEPVRIMRRIIASFFKASSTKSHTLLMLLWIFVGSVLMFVSSIVLAYVTTRLTYSLILYNSFDDNSPVNRLWKKAKGGVKDLWARTWWRRRRKRREEDMVNIDIA